MEGARRWGSETLSIRPAVALDAHRFAPVIAEEDADEIRALTGLDPLEGFLCAHASSDEDYAAELSPSGDIIGFWGAKDLKVTRSASVWLICSPRVKEHPIIFQRLVRGTLKDLSMKYGLLLGVGDERNQHHLRWVNSLGFKITRTLPEYGAERRTFYEFGGRFD